MIIARQYFADVYSDLFTIMKEYETNIECRGKSICYELLNVQLIFNPIINGISIYSHKVTRAFPIKFALAEFAWIMAKSNDLGFISKYNKAMESFSDNGETLYGAYGYRLDKQIDACIDKLKNDKYSRQAFATIYDRYDIFANTKDVPCNTSLQFCIRNNELILTVNSRSSDFITGLPIDAFHWQLLLSLVYQELRETYSELFNGRVVYNIASLHIYSTDKEAFDTFTDYFMPYDDCCHSLHLLDNETYTNVVKVSRSFLANTSSSDTYHKHILFVINFQHDSFTKIQCLQEIFKSRTNRFTR